MICFCLAVDNFSVWGLSQLIYPDWAKRSICVLSSGRWVLLVAFRRKMTTPPAINRFSKYLVNNLSSSSPIKVLRALINTSNALAWIVEKTVTTNCSFVRLHELFSFISDLSNDEKVRRWRKESLTVVIGHADLVIRRKEAYILLDLDRISNRHDLLVRKALLR